MLGLASCQTEPEGLNVNVGGEVDTTVCVSLPEATRANSALGAFDNVDLTGNLTIRYIFEVYYGNTGVQKQVYYTDDKTASFPVRLVPGRDYNFVAWADIVAQPEDAKMGKALPYEDGNVVVNHYDANDLDAIKFIGAWNAMDETRDAYSGFHNTKGYEKYTGTSSINIQMTRPFAKLRVITTDMVELNALGIAPVSAKVTYSAFSHQSFNALNGTYSKQTITEEHVYEIANYADQYGANKVLFTDYFFAADNDVVKFQLDVYDSATQNETTLIKHNDFTTDIPVKRNYLTTIQGNVLTDGNNINVTVIDRFDGTENWPDTTAEQLAYAAMFGGEVTLTEDVVLTEPLTIVNGANVVINLNDQTIYADLKQEGRHHYAIDNYGTLTLKGNGAINARGVENFGTMTVEEGITITNVDTNGGAAIWNEGNLTINGGTFKTNNRAGEGSYGAALNTRHGGKAVVNGGTFEAYSQLTYAIINDGETTIYNADVKSKHGAVAGAETGDKTTIKGGTFALSENPGVSDHCVYCVSAIEGGKFTLGNNTDCGAQVFYASTIAAGYKAVEAGDLYYVLPEIIANAAEAAGVTSVTESTYDVATALATNNGEVALFMWNDVAYIAKYGEVVITSAADEATTVRGVVESSTGLTSATIADGIEVVGNRTFRKCANLETVALPNTLTEIGPAVFQSCSKLANITIPESVTTIGEGAFAECTALTSINIPSGITRLEKDVLRNTGLISVEIPASVKYIGTYAFRDCESLTEIKILSPEFTIETNTFTNTAAPVPTMTIHVVNAEMKAYLESVLTNYDKSYITVVSPEAVNTTAGLQAALANDKKIVTVAAGDYTFPSSSVQAGQTIICEEGTVFTGKSSLDINGATVIGAEFKNENGTAVSGTIYGNFKNCTFTGPEALRCCYSGAGKTTVFENCVIKTDFRGFHYDGMDGDVIFRNCEINGFNAYGGDGTVTFEGCTFGCDESPYNGLNIYSNTNIVNCTFNYVSGKTNFIDMEGTGKTLTITNCTATLDGAAANVADFVGGSKLNDNTVIIK